MQFAPRDLVYVEQAIAQAMLKLQWLAQKERPGSILGTLNVRDHQAVIRITNGSIWLFRRNRFGEKASPTGFGRSCGLRSCGFA